MRKPVRATWRLHVADTLACAAAGALLPVAAALAALGERPVSGKEFLAAIIAGAEVNNRLFLSIQPAKAMTHSRVQECSALR